MIGNGRTYPIRALIIAGGAGVGLLAAGAVVAYAINRLWEELQA